MLSEAAYSALANLIRGSGSKMFLTFHVLLVNDSSLLVPIFELLESYSW